MIADILHVNDIEFHMNALLTFKQLSNINKQKYMTNMLADVLCVNDEQQSDVEFVYDGVKYPVNKGKRAPYIDKPIFN